MPKTLNHTLTGNIKLHQALRSRFVRERRDVIVYLPPEYEAARDRRYPVLYLHDGQNLFDATTAFLGNDWGLDEVAEELIGSGQIQPLILVGIYNTPKRMAEYTPVRDRRGRGGRARAYGKIIVEELKPLVDSTYRTLPDRANTGLGGSSLGGLVTLYLGLQYPDVFGKLIVMSPSVWWANRAILKEVRKLPHKVGAKIWLDIGTCEGQNPQVCVQNTVALRDALIEKGWQPGQDLAFVEDDGAGHDEKAWGYRMRDALRFLFPPE
ncbi:MAG: alpha/beta hydrolase [Acidobacteriaceae bacterium]|nr:alpha/beta hydrolase [Acidobacteriaceae bacterium]MBV9500653.1 alpha/beta hydrolase [Acidobacteriaceae bacterium]